MTGRMIGNYRIIAKIGEGGMGKVYRAIDTMVEREIALKSLRPEIAAQPGLVERFRSEAVLLARLNHPAIAQLYTFFKDADEYYMVMEFVAGETLQDLVLRESALHTARALAYTAQILQGVGHAHSMGILHRDLKPANIMITPAEKVKIMDFGIARALGSAGMTRDGRVIGTLEYLAPERIRGKQDDPRSDLYSVGVVLYQMLTGHLPFESDSDYDLLTAQIQKQPPRPEEIGIALPPDVETLLMTSLEKDPERRYSDAAAFEAAIANILGAPRSVPASGRVAEMETRLSRLIVQTRTATGPDSKETRLAATPTPVPPTIESPFGRPTRISSETPTPPAPQTPPQAPPPPTVLASVPPAQPTRETPRPKTPRRIGTGLIIGIVAAGLVLAAGASFLVFRHFHQPAPPPASQQQAAVTFPPPAPSQPQGEVQPDTFVVTPSPDTGDTASSGSKPAANTGGGLFPGNKAGKDKKGKTESSTAKTTPTPTPTPVLINGVSPEARQAALAALDQTDGPAEGEAGVRPIQMAGLLAALKAGGPSMEGDIEVAIGRRGIAFPLTSPRADTLRAAGASDSFLKVVGDHFRGKPEVAAAKPAEAAKPAQAAQRIMKLGDAKSVFVDCQTDELRNAVREEIKKQFGAKLQLMDAPAGSDVLMKVTLSGPNGGAVSRALRIKDSAQVRAVVVDGASGASLWEEGAGDRKFVIGILGDSVKRMASRIVKEMKDASAKK